MVKGTRGSTSFINALPSKCAWQKETLLSLLPPHARLLTKGMKMKTGNLVTVKEMAERLSVPVSWLYQRTRLGQKVIPHLRLGKYIRFDLDEVMAFFREHGDTSAL